KRLEDSYSFYLNEIKRFSSKVAKEIGIEKKKVCMMSTKSKEALRNSYLEDLLDDYHFLTEEEVKERFGKDSKLFAATYTTLLVYAPWIKEALYLDSDTYIIPGVDGAVTLGGTRQFESTREEIDKHDSAGIWERCTQVENSLKDAKILREWVGFRPYRPYVRVEKEIMKFPNGKSIK
ncbi:hypothetical protein Avbf_18190, partial [Armadillidium vulgare]